MPSARGRRHREGCARLYALTGANVCTYCGRSISRDLPVGHEQKATCDHVHVDDGGYGTVAAGGIDELENYLPCCSRCNSSKGSRSVRGWLRDQCAPPWCVSGWCVNPQDGGTSRQW